MAVSPDFLARSAQRGTVLARSVAIFKLSDVPSFSLFDQDPALDNHFAVARAIAVDNGLEFRRRG